MSDEEYNKRSALRERFRNWKHVMVAYAETSSGPGWANQLVRVIGIDIDGRLVQDALQPDEQSQEMLTLFSCSLAASAAMTGVARWHLKVGI